MVQKDDVDSQTVAIIGVFAAIVTFALIVGAQVLYYRMQKADEYRKVVAPGSTDLQNVVTEQRAAISTYHWVDKEKGVVAIPIERAMNLVLQQLQTAKP
jgi:hypothetical protein